MSTSIALRKRAWRCLAVLTLGMYALTGCGGGGSESSGNVQEADPPEAPGSTDQFLSTGVVAYEVTFRSPFPNAPTIYDTSVYAAIDPTDRQRQQSFRGYLWNIKLVPALRYDADSGSVTVLGSSKAFHLKEGRLFQIDLRRGGDMQPSRLSRLDKICEITSVFPASWSAQDGWVEVSIAPTGSCLDVTGEGSPVPGPRQTHYIRFNAPATDPGLQLPEGLVVWRAVRTVAQDGRWFFSVGPNSFFPGDTDSVVLYDADLKSARDTSPALLPPLLDAPSEQLAELLTQLTTGNVGGQWMSADNETYVIGQPTSNILTIMRNAGGTSSVFATMDVTYTSDFSLKAITPTHVLVQQRMYSQFSLEPAILWAFPKDGGQPVPLNEVPPSYASSWKLTFLGYDDLYAYYETQTGMYNPAAERFASSSNAIYRVRLRDGVKTQLGGNTLKTPLPLTDRQRRMSVPPLRGLAWMEFSNDYSNNVGTLRVFDTAAEQTRTLGQLDNGEVYHWNWNVLGSHNEKNFYWDSMLSIATIQYDNTTVAGTSKIRHYTAKPDAANSLTEVTRQP